jgi:hypothetical protein
MYFAVPRRLISEIYYAAGCAACSHVCFLRYLS